MKAAGSGAETVFPSQMRRDFWSELAELLLLQYHITLSCMENIPSHYQQTLRRGKPRLQPLGASDFLTLDSWDGVHGD